MIFKKHTPKIILLYNYIINQKTNQANLQNYLKWHYGVRLYYRLRLCFIHEAEVEDWLRQSVVGDKLCEWHKFSNSRFLARTADNSAVRRTLSHKTKKHAPKACFCFGGAKRIRTAGLLVANEALYQLSHNPMSITYYILFFFVCQRFFIRILNFFIFDLFFVD